MIFKKYFAMILFILGFGIFMFSRISKIFPFINISIIIAPVFILRFIRTQSTKKGIFLTLFGFILSMNLALYGLFDIGDRTLFLVFNLLRSVLLAVLYSLPYIADRLIYPKLKGKGILSVLIFPIIVTAIFFLFSLEGPFDGDGVFAVFIYGNLIFKQLASITGLWGFVFIFSWFASVINYAWENNFALEKIRKNALIFLSILLVIFLFGRVKTSPLMSSDSERIKIAAVTLIPDSENKEILNLETIWSNKITSPFEKIISKVEGLTKKVALNGAKIVVLQEYTMTINEEQENKLLYETKRIAKENNIYLSITYGIFAEKGKGRNKHLLINNQEEILIDYTKRYLFGFGPFGETAVMEKGPEVIQTTDTPYGRIGISICRDMSFPPYIRQAGEKNVDIMLSSAYDWPRSKNYPCYIRSIENGFSFVRSTYNGISFAVDYNGKSLADNDFYDTEDGIMYADVPTKGIKTVYSVIGDLLAWLCVLGFVGLIVIGIKNRNK